MSISGQQWRGLVYQVSGGGDECPRAEVEGIREAGQRWRGLVYQVSGGRDEYTRAEVEGMSQLGQQWRRNVLGQM